MARLAVLAAAALAVAASAARSPVVHTNARSGDCALPNMRPPAAQRKFPSAAVDALIADMVPKFKDPNLAQLFANAFPNTLDTTVYSYVPTGTTGAVNAPDTFLVTGDIPASWLRDSSNQFWPYLRFVATDASLRDLAKGLIGRQARSVLIDPYANAFQIDALHGLSPNAGDSTSRPAYAGTSISAMTAALWERKWEADSLSNVLRLSSGYYNASGGDKTPFNAQWLAAVELILDTFDSQRLDTAQEDAAGGPAYSFQRNTGEPSDTLEHGRGEPALYTGMIKSAFRGSDDATMFPYNIGENAFAATALYGLVPLLTDLGQAALAQRAAAMAAGIVAAIETYGAYVHPVTGTRVYAYETDGFGNFYFMDDPNVPGLLSMPYYGYTNASDPLYLATRAAIFSRVNPYFLNGTAAAGLGGPHNGWPFVWPMATITQAWTSEDEAEIAQCLETLLAASACTGLVHESFDKDNFGSYTRPWFAWVNGYFGDLILKIAAERPSLIFK